LIGHGRVPILVAALSGRALAAAARRAGAEIVVADFFGDLDTRSLAPWMRLPGSLAAGIDRRRLRGTASEACPLAGIVYGAGFEHAPALLRDLATLAPLIGNAPETVAAAKDPFGFAAVLSRLGLPHPMVSDTSSPGGAFLRKRRGGTGGTHIRRADAQSVAGRSHYYQAFAAGRPFSALFAANGREARIVGLSRQWTAPTAAAPFRYGGCAGPVTLPPRLAHAIAESCTALTVSLGLVGLNSLDVLVEGDDFTILEINPRPGATIDIFDGATPDALLWEWHLRAVRGELPPAPTTPQGDARAAAVLYAEAAITVQPAMPWEDWVADLPAPCSVIPAGAPICTVLADGPDAAAAEGLVRARSAALHRRLSSPRRLPSRGHEAAHEHHAAS
jgi:predicted ATP-grasp superfamily ATP-dependent carboligase